MKQPAQVPKISPLAKNIFVICLCLFSLSVIILFVFLKLESRVEEVNGKVVDRFTKEVATGRKSVGEKMFLEIKYSINGKEYSGEAPCPVKNGMAANPDYIPVYYYAALPSWSWFFDRSNHHVIYSVLLVLVTLVLLLFSWRDIRNEKKAHKTLK